ncbi:MAG: glycosyltransferase family 87 protein [Candidatus Aminicenantes bacterium]|nr:glycosyltransferase family 87 protein [Candidatus Aminicenantes bacterium]
MDQEDQVLRTGRVPNLQSEIKRFLYNILILALTLLALERFFGSQQRLLPGILIALASAIKPFAALLLIPFLFRAHWRLFAGFLFGLLVSIIMLPVVLLGPNQTRVLISDWNAKVMISQQK